MKTSSKEVFRICAVLGTALILVACGGGGGGTTAPAAPIVLASVIVNCPNGSSTTATGADTAAATATANAACPAPKVVSISPSSGAIVPASNFKEVIIMSDSTLDATKLTASSVQTSIPGNVSPVGANGVRFALTTPAADGQAYSLAATVTDTLGKTATVTVIVSTNTPPVPTSCPAPSVFMSGITSGINACVYPIGVKVSGANTLPQGCDRSTQQCWKDSIANGTVKLIATPAKMVGYSDRPVIFAYYKNTSEGILGGKSYTGLWNTLPIYGDDGTITGADIFAGGTQEVDWVYGTEKGIIIHEKSSDLCFDYTWYPPTTQQNTNSNIWTATQLAACPK